MILPVISGDSEEVSPGSNVAIYDHTGLDRDAGFRADGAQYGQHWDIDNEEAETMRELMAWILLTENIASPLHLRLNWDVTARHLLCYLGPKWIVLSHPTNQTR